MNSYPEALGQILVTMIKTEDYKKWGEILLDKIDVLNHEWKWNFEDLLQYCEVTKGMIKMFCPSLRISNFVTKFNFNEKTFLKEIFNLSIIEEWVYIIDLDVQEFKVQISENDYIIFDINKIPINWIEKLKEKLK